MKPQKYLARVLSILLGLFYLLAVIGVPICMLYQISNVALRRYYMWTDLFPDCADFHIEDLFLSRISLDNRKDTFADVTSDLVVVGLLGFFVLLSLLTGKLAVLARYTFTLAILFSLNAILEGVTTVPSSYGKPRAVVENPPRDDFFLALGGTAASMMWSGHTVICFSAVYFLFLLFETKGKEYSYAYQVSKWMVILGITVLAMVLILLSYNHYSVDLFVGLTVAFLFVTNDYWTKKLEKVNPFPG